MTIKKSHLKDLQELQNIRVGPARGEGQCSLPWGTVPARQFWLHRLTEMDACHYYVLMERWGEEVGSRSPFVLFFFPSSKSVLRKFIYFDHFCAFGLYIQLLFLQSSRRCRLRVLRWHHCKPRVGTSHWAHINIRLSFTKESLFETDSCLGLTLNINLRLLSVEALP